MEGSAFFVSSWPRQTDRQTDRQTEKHVGMNIFDAVLPAVIATPRSSELGGGSNLIHFMVDDSLERIASSSLKSAPPRNDTRDNDTTGARQELTRMSAPEYWTRDGLKKTAGFKILDPQTLVVSVKEPASTYPLLIDPTLSWGQWFGGGNSGGDDQVKALAVNGSTVYAGGTSDSSGAWESVTFQGSHSGSAEGFVVSITDGATPSLNWGQWLGGSNNDQVNALAVTESVIFAGGYSQDSASWESVTFQGDMVASEGFVVKITDGEIGRAHV